MKKIFLGCLITLFGIFNSRGQGSDIIFWVDNSGSINNNLTTEYADMSASIQAIMTNVLQCNPLNRVCFIQYGGGRTFIETPFQNFAMPILRRYPGGAGDAHTSLGAINAALNGVQHPALDPAGLQTLNFTPGNARVVYLFTDAGRNADLTNAANGIGTNAAFLNFTNFKNVWNATFIVTMVPPNIQANNAGAAVASVGGNYNGTIENYPADPDGPGQLPRYFLSSANNNFLLSQADINLVTQDICSVTPQPCVQNIVRLPVQDDVSVQDNQEASISITASNKINNGAIGIYHAGSNVVLAPGFHSAIGSRFRAYIETCSGDFHGKVASAKTDYATEIDGNLLVYPNPVADDLNIESVSAVSHIDIITMEGIKVYQNDYLKGQKSVQVNILNLNSGLYILNVRNEDGKTTSKKIIKQ